MVVIFINIFRDKSIELIFHRDKKMSSLTVFFPAIGLISKMVTMMILYLLDNTDFSYTNMLIVVSILKYHISFLFLLLFSDAVFYKTYVL